MEREGVQGIPEDLPKASRPAAWRSVPTRISLKAKGIIAFVALVGYIFASALVISDGRARLNAMVEDLERLYRHEEMLLRANITVARGLLTVNEQYFSEDLDATVQPVLLEIGAVQSTVSNLRSAFPQIGPALRDLESATEHLRDTPARSDIAHIRSALHKLVEQLEGITRLMRERKGHLIVEYRLANDGLTLKAVIMVLLGIVVFSSVTALFFRRLTWDIGKLEERAMDIVSGYRGTPLEITRGDEIGGLMQALNNMQAELRERETQLELSRQLHFHREKMAAVGSLAAAVAHEINNPIAAIAGIAQSISEMRHDHGCAYMETGCQPELILEQARRVSAITRQISEFVAPQSPEPQLLDLNALVRSTCNFISYDRRFNRIDLKTELDEQLPALYDVADHLTQVLMNLMINAADATDQLTDRRPAITVSTRVAGDRVLLQVSDNGMGMSEATKMRAFEEFFTTKPVGKGTGLGLALCKNLIEAGGGRILIDSEPGVGTTVTVELSTEIESKLAA